ncbi:UPF0287-domain-containing protein [Coniophora puteana RWD-64-598 SS2]|uniref:COX assembly mitochondrial protein n=1 Tax=Coniophora puteana (strain RWD-64-598) TaxID=741705 RepID=A0A5M3N2L7_CONPW|nr:UPF0287-domain-containing protein [Coniophora puteana RWD-64-598 SS2]EIW85264.1 UPF0287-domain-containing protein [Coniophora puteana RWD-64-598 SS2]
MHPQLSDKRLGVYSQLCVIDYPLLNFAQACREFIQALDACHASNWARLTGGCNKEKLRLNECLHKESLARSSRNREHAKEQRLKTEQSWKELHEND